MGVDWLDELKSLVEKNPIVILEFDDDEWKRLYESRLSISEFTVARPHALLASVKKSTPCLIQAKSNDEEHLCFGIISSKATITTLESRIKVKRAVQIRPRTKTELFRLLSKKPHANKLREKLRGKESVIPLSPKLSVHLIERLASIDENRGAMRAVTESLSTPRRFKDANALQEDAVRTALGVFGFTATDQVCSLDRSRCGLITRVWIA